MMLDDDTMEAIATVAADSGIPPAALAAVAHVESGLRVHAMIDGRPEPLIRYEGHYFDQRLTGKVRAEARRRGLADPKAGAIANPASQAGRWKLLRSAAAIDHKAAHESVSWGIGQVMGAHWAWLGYASVDDLVAEARSGTRGQLRLMVRYIVKAGLAPALGEKRWSTFARGYNGPGYRRYAYDAKLARAHARYADVFRGVPATARTLSVGARGSEVSALQECLRTIGYDIVVDGYFGIETQRIVAAFQSDSGLPVDGIVGALTRQAIERGGTAADQADEPALSWPGNLLGRLFRYLI